MAKEEIQVVKNPIAGLLCIGIGLIIVSSGLNVHSGEIFLWLLGVFGFILIFPIILFAKSVQVLKKAETKSSARVFAILLTAALAMLWASFIIVTFLKEW